MENTNSVDENQTSHIPSEGSLKTSELKAAPSFTPGPWRFHEGSQMVLACADQMTICNVRGWGYLTGVGALNLPPEAAVKIQDENGRLIAAAPALYEALVVVVAIADRKTVEFDKARAALALVTTQETKSAEVGTGE